MRSCTLALLAGATTLFTAVGPAGAVTLTGAIEFSTDGSGNNSGGQGWSTIGNGAIFGLWMSLNPDASSPLNGPAEANAPISIPLGIGSHTFYTFGSPGNAIPNNGINLFFGSAAPGISAFGPINTTSFSADSGSTQHLDGSVTPGAGTLSFTSGGTTVTLTGYEWNDPTNSTNLPIADRVSGLTFAPDGTNDFRGLFTLNVTSTSAVPEPSEGALVAAGCALLAGLRRRATAIAIRKRR